MKRFENKTVLVTGGGQGIGRAIALRFAREGASVVVNDLGDNPNVGATMAAIEEAGAKGVFVPADVSKVTEVTRMVESGENAFGGLDVLVNNAGIEMHAPFWEVTEAQYDRVMDVNLKGAFFAAQAFAKTCIKAKRGGRIINISSVHEEVPFPNFAAYCASKGGMKMMMRNLSVELAPYGVTVNDVAPGAIRTPINASLVNKPELLSSLLNNISLGRLGEPADVAGVVAFLASEDAGYVTGSTYYVDGGLTWHYEEQ